MKAQFLACGTRNAKHKGEQLQLVAVEANGLVRDESSALIGSPPCGSCSVCKLAHCVYKYGLNECPSKVRSARRADGGFYLVFEVAHFVYE